MGKTILIVDDDPHILEIIGFALANAHMDCVSAKDGCEAIERFREGAFDLIVLDICMPELDGLGVCQEIRKISDVPILFLSSRDEEVDIIVGLEIGGDDYLTKPFSPRELVARIKVILKRTTLAAIVDDKIVGPVQHGKLALDNKQHRASYSGKEAQLTAREFALLEIFISRPQWMFERAHLIKHAYGENIHVSDRTIDSHIRHIRVKFAALGCGDLIETVHGIGYRLGDCE